LAGRRVAPVLPRRTAALRVDRVGTRLRGWPHGRGTSTDLRRRPLQPLHLVVILVIVLVVFGAGRLTGDGQHLGLRT
jgi:mttA/Hcf106 family